jgi:hypothetical protein
LCSYRQGIRRRRLYERREVDGLLQVRPSGGEPPRAARPEVPRAEDWIPFVN